MGYGIGGGKMAATMDKGTVVDLTTQDGRNLSSKARPQIDPIAGLSVWSQVVTRDGKQTQTVGHHFTNDGRLSAEQRVLMDRPSVCIGCHQHIPTQDLAVSLLHHVAEHAGLLPGKNCAHASLLSKISRTAAWAPIVGAALLALGVPFLFRRIIKLRRAK